MPSLLSLDLGSRAYNIQYGMVSNEMNCEETREGILKPETVIERKSMDVNRFLRHVRTCPDCRRDIPSEARATAVHAVVMAIND